METLLTKQEVAKALAVSLSTVDRLIAAGRFRVVRIGRAVRVRQIDLEKEVRKCAER